MSNNSEELVPSGAALGPPPRGHRLTQNAQGGISLDSMRQPRPEEAQPSPRVQPTGPEKFAVLGVDLVGGMVITTHGHIPLHPDHRERVLRAALRNIKQFFSAQSPAAGRKEVRKVRAGVGAGGVLKGRREKAAVVPRV